ncbi:Carbohydrate sulfotransferase 8 [Saguinus oedipus]|uniref:Carbohydrate sulfotransferase 8 n=1 Tax=Saguinus oedipus TaxID=9490 RepID=A0ABQ9TTR4_SAGOE|nr:Carbohydrate sulfotransferase 8 [Saguinus oedipus]
MTQRPGMMRLACMFSSVLLFGAAGLLLFISLQDPTELASQQAPGESLRWVLPSLPPAFQPEAQASTAALVCWP